MAKAKIYVPTILQKKIVQWYHTMLCHPRENRTEATIHQHYYWSNLRDTVVEVVKPCHICQVSKKGQKNYGQLPAKEAEAVPWETLCVDLIGPYTVRPKDKKKHLIL